MAVVTNPVGAQGRLVHVGKLDGDRDDGVNDDVRLPPDLFRVAGFDFEQCGWTWPHSPGLRPGPRLSGRWPRQPGTVRCRESMTYCRVWPRGSRGLHRGAQRRARRCVLGHRPDLGQHVEPRRPRRTGCGPAWKSDHSPGSSALAGPHPDTGRSVPGVKLWMMASSPVPLNSSSVQFGPANRPVDTAGRSPISGEGPSPSQARSTWPAATWPRRSPPSRSGAGSGGSSWRVMVTKNLTVLEPL